MLVHAKTRKGVLCVSGYKIYGVQTNMPPTDVPYEFYKTYRNALDDATYREGILNSIFKVNLPSIGFRYREIGVLADRTLDMLVEKIGYNTIKSNRVCQSLQGGLAAIL
jgi:hypothetical protein